MRFGLSMLFLGLTTFGLAACAAQPDKPLYGSADFVPPIDEIMPGQTLTAHISGSSRLGEMQTATFPLAFARICNAAKTSCRAAIVYTAVTYGVESIDGDGIVVSGRLLSKMGKTQTFNSSMGGVTMSNTETVLDGVDVIGERTEDRPFHSTLRLGQALTLPGLLGSTVTLIFSSSPFF